MKQVLLLYPSLDMKNWGSERLPILARITQSVMIQLLLSVDISLEDLHRTQYNFKYMLCYAKSLKSCPTLCDPIDGSPPGFPVPGILQARTLEWVVISFSNAWKWKEKVKSLSRVRLLATPRTVAHQAPPYYLI